MHGRACIGADIPAGVAPAGSAGRRLSQQNGAVWGLLLPTRQLPLTAKEHSRGASTPGRAADDCCELQHALPVFSVSSKEHC